MLVAAQPGNIHLVKGQKFIMDNKITALTSQTFMGQAIASNADLVTHSSIQVNDVTGDRYTLTSNYSLVKFNMSAMGNDLSFDSDKKEDREGEHGAAFKDFLDQPKEVSIDKRGKVLSPLDDSSVNTEVEIVKMMVQQLIGEPQETGYGITMAFSPVPRKTTVGFSWTDTTNHEGLFKTTTYTIKEIKGQDALISITGLLNTDVKTEMQGMEVVNRSTGKITGEQNMDIGSGLIRERKTVVESSGTITLQGQDLPMTTTVTYISQVKPVL